ncbi:MAG TPA: septation protein SepH [Marmoricola sp.]|nr:septation protein SepH [Marmoricola sp.]
MQHLTPVGLSKDGKQLVLVSDTGEEFAVPMDTKLRAALRGDHARLGQLEMKMESALRPRDIQARIRGGESAEDVAAAAQTTVDAIMGFAAPVLAERAHVAENAQKSSIRRRSTDATTAAGTLDQAARTHLSNIGVRADDVEWDAWRRDDGRWTLVAQYFIGGATLRAEFTYDQPGRYVVADNQEARLLTGEATSAVASGGQARRLSSVPSESPRSDDELPLADHELGDDAIELVRGDDELTADHGDADWITDTSEVDEPSTEEAADDADEADDDAPAAEAAPGSKPHRKGRSSVPSWDEIMFGGGKGE